MIDLVKPELLVDEIVYPRRGDVTIPVRWGTLGYAKANNSNDGVKSITITHNMAWGPMVNTLKRDVEYKIVGNEIIILERTFNTLTLNNPLLFTVAFDVTNESTITDTFNFRAQ